MPSLRYFDKLSMNFVGIGIKFPLSSKPFC